MDKKKLLIIATVLTVILLLIPIIVLASSKSNPIQGSAPVLHKQKTNFQKSIDKVDKTASRIQKTVYSKVTIVDETYWLITYTTCSKQKVKTELINGNLISSDKMDKCTAEEEAKLRTVYNVYNYAFDSEPLSIKVILK